VIVGALGIGFANAMHGEISPAMARAVSESRALKLLVPVSRCNVEIVGAAEKNMAALLDDVAARLKTLMAEKE